MKNTHLLEIGCGVGNSVLPLLELNPDLQITAFDFAHSAISILQENPLFLSNKHRMKVSVCDVTTDHIPVQSHVDSVSNCNIYIILVYLSGPMHIRFICDRSRQTEVCS